MEAYASVYDQSEQIDEGITSIITAIKKLKKPAPTSKAPGVKRAPGEGGKKPKRDSPGAGGKIKIGLPMNREDVDVFDVVKGYLMSEHDLTEEQALKFMLELEDEHRDAIIENLDALK